MGAATALLHGHRDPSIAGMVLDSPFSNLKDLSLELVDSNTKIPTLISKIALKFIRSTISEKVGFDLYDVNPIADVESCFIPALFLAGKGDTFVRPKHSETIYEKYGGEKEILLFEGDHNGDRPEYVLDAVAAFFY